MTKEPNNQGTRRQVSTELPLDLSTELEAETACYTSLSTNAQYLVVFIIVICFQD